MKRRNLRGEKLFLSKGLSLWEFEEINMNALDSNSNQSFLDPDDYESLINELVPSDCNCEYCFLKFYLIHCHSDRRMLVQLKCIEMFKWERSAQNRHNCGWQNAIMAWADEGYAKAFADCYSPYSHIDDIYAHCKRIVEGDNSGVEDSGSGGWEQP